MKTRNKLVLVVEDDFQFRDYISTLLKTAGYEVCVATDLPEAEAQFKYRRPDLILTDLVLPGNGDGNDLIRQIREKAPDRPVIAMSGGHRNSDAYLSNAANFGADAILPKPFPAKDLLETLELFLELC